MVTLIICLVWFYNVVKHCNRTDSVLKLLFGNSFERSRLIILIASMSNENIIIDTKITSNSFFARFKAN